MKISQKARFEKNYIVWKLNFSIFGILLAHFVWEELYSMETKWAAA